MPLDLQCWNCGEIFYETNDHDGYFTPEGEGAGQIANPRVRAFRLGAVPNGAMFRLKEPYAGYGWEGFPHDESVIGDALECVGCGTPYISLETNQLKLLKQNRGKSDKPQKRAHK